MSVPSTSTARHMSPCITPEILVTLHFWFAMVGVVLYIARGVEQVMRARPHTGEDQGPEVHEREPHEKKGRSVCRTFLAQINAKRLETIPAARPSKG